MPPLTPQWRSIDERWREHSAGRSEEFPSGVVSRRAFLRALSLPAAAGLAACGPPPDVVSYVQAPEDMVPGEPRFYATAVQFDGIAQPVIAECHDGRPTKLEGNPGHPCSGGATDAFTQAGVGELYCPERSAAPRYRGRPSAWSDAEAMLLRLRAQLAASAGEGARLLVGPSSSPTLQRQLAALRAAYPRARVHMMPAAGEGARFEALRSTFGRGLDLHLHPEAADVIVSFDDDFLGPGAGQVAIAGRWAARRRQAAAGKGRALLHVMEATPSSTGATATTRAGAGTREIAMALQALAQRLGVLPGKTTLVPDHESWVAARAAELTAARGASLVTAGAYLPEDVQSLAFAINHALGNTGVTVRYTRPAVFRDELASLADLMADMRAGVVQTLIVIDANPVYAAGGLDFAKSFAGVPQRLHMGIYDDETAAAAIWHLPLAHALESWSDARAVDGAATILQPLVTPFLDVRPLHEVVQRLLDGEEKDARTIVRATWATGTDDRDTFWRRALDRGLVENSAAANVEVRAAAVSSPAPVKEGVEVLIRPDPTIWDGRFAAVPWLQELPKPLTKVVWDNVILLSPASAKSLGAGEGDLVRVEIAGGRALIGPAWPMPGQARDTVVVFLGYGRRRAGRYATDIGYDATVFQTGDEPWRATGRVTRVTGRREIATTQQHSSMDGFDFVRAVPRSAPAVAPAPEASSLYPPWPRGETAWGMVIDLDLCIGCNACVTACQAENNIPTVGRDQVARGREMHWLRIDRYFERDEDAPKVHFQPVPCMHCEQAPCEMGCPVHATVHSSEGLNQMVYNRCIGTRTCSSYCPYKVRRFNFYNYTGDTPQSQQAQFNPDVTVRGRGIMEKCTYCIQRINTAKVAAQKEGRDIHDGDVRTACQAACPTAAIVFGNIADPASAVAAAKADPRGYSLLAEQNTRPRTTYLAKIEDREDST